MRAGCAQATVDESLGRERRLVLDGCGESQRQARADARQAGRDLREVARDRQLVAVEAQVAVIGGVGVERAVAQAAHSAARSRAVRSGGVIT